VRGEGLKEERVKEVKERRMGELVVRREGGDRKSRQEEFWLKLMSLQGFLRFSNSPRPPRRSRRKVIIDCFSFMSLEGRRK